MYSAEVVVSLAQNCVTDSNLVVFFENQIIERKVFEKEVVDAAADLLAVTLLDESLIDKNARILTQLTLCAPD